MPRPVRLHQPTFPAELIGQCRSLISQCREIMSIAITYNVMIARVRVFSRAGGGAVRRGDSRMGDQRPGRGGIVPGKVEAIP
jgi:hypothetical protein